MYLTCKVQKLVPNPNFDSNSPASQSNQPSILDEHVHLVSNSDISSFVDEQLEDNVIIVVGFAPDIWS